MKTLLVAFLVCIAATVEADLVEPERLEAWDRWREQPLDLRDASEADLALLPGSDRAVARAITRLREADPDFTRADLRNIDGLDVHALDDWDELVVRTIPRGVDFGVTSENASHRTALGVHRGRWRSALVHRDEPGVTRGWVRVRVGRTEWTAGALRFDAGSGLGVGDALGRTRSGPVRRPRPARVRGRTDASEAAGWTALATTFETPAGRVHAVFGNAADRTRVGAMSFDARDGRHGALLRIDGRSARIAAWTRREIADRWEVWSETSTSARVDDGAVTLGTRRRWRGAVVGAAWTRASGARPDARDPITGAWLDRPHGAWQFDARARHGPYRVEAFLRHRRRDESVDERLRLDLSWVRPREYDGEARWSVHGHVGFDEDVDGAAVDPRLRAEVQRSDATTRWVMTWARRGPASDAVESFAVRGRRRFASDPWSHLEIGFGTAAGARAVPWFVVRPGAGIRPLWIPGSGEAVWVAGGGHLGRVRWGLWTWWRGPVDDAPFGVGLQLRAKTGTMVRRLQ